MTTLRSYQCNFCREEYSNKNSFRDINDIVGLKWETRTYGGTPYDKAETIEILKELSKENAENHLCKRCLKAIKDFMPHYIDLKAMEKSKKGKKS